MKLLHSDILSNLDLFNKIMPYIDNTITKYGHDKLKESFSIYYTEKKDLLKLQNNINKLLKSDNVIAIRDELKNIKKIEDDIEWFVSANNDHNPFIFATSPLNHEFFITTKNFIRIYNPIIGIIIYFLIYMVYRYHNENINIKQFFVSIYHNYNKFTKDVLNMLIKSKGTIETVTKFIVVAYIVYKIYATYTAFDDSEKHQERCRLFKKKFVSLKSFVKHSTNIYNFDNFLSDERKTITSDLRTLRNAFLSKKIFSLGYDVLLKQNSGKYMEAFNNVLQYVGKVDAFVNNKHLIEDLGFTQPKYHFTTSGPLISLNKLSVVYLDKDTQVNNDCKFLQGNFMLLTGSNESGRSTYIKNVTLSVIMAQSLGVTPCENLTLTPFTYIKFYTSSPHYNNGDSLFQTQITICRDFCNKIASLSNGQYSFAGFDDMFSITSPKESAALSYAFCKYVGNNKKCLSIFSTHNDYLNKLPQENPDIFFSMKVNELKVVQKGINTDTNLIELLKKNKTR